MESQLLLSLDSLWFFSNIFSCTTKTHNHMDMVLVLVGAADQNSTNQAHAEIDIDKEHVLVETEEVFLGKDSKPISQTVQIEQKCGENESPGTRSAERRTSARRSKRRSRCCNQRREVFGELKLGCLGAKECSSWMVVDEVERYLYGDIQSPGNGVQNLPPFNVNDGVAMKEHLKSWAYAVASTVK